MERILITGSLGQIGSELSSKLMDIYGESNVIVTDIKSEEEASLKRGIYEQFDVMDNDRLNDLVDKYQITTIYHLASLLSGTAEKNPFIAWRLNVTPLLQILDLAKQKKIKKIFWPSSIAVFGKGAPKYDVPQDVVLNPTTVYGISKVAGEKWCSYFNSHFGVDVRSIRYPGLISWKTPAGGGTTDYAVEIFYEALQKGHYDCFLTENTALPMLYMDDAIDATLKLMDAPAENLRVRESYNLGGLSFTPRELFHAIKKELPNFTISYKPDFRQSIADSWPASIDDSVAKADWGLNYQYDLNAMCKEMITHLKVKFNL